MIFLQSDNVCNMTRLNRAYERRVLLFMGNKEGMISYGIGRGAEYREAYVKACQELKKNLITIEHDQYFSCPSDLTGRFNDFKLHIKSRYEPKIWGNPLMALMIRYAGIFHSEFYCISRKKERYAMLFAFFRAVTKNRTPLHVSEIFGTKNYRKVIGRPKKYSSCLSENINHA